MAISGDNIVGTAGWHERNIRHAYVGPGAFERGIGTLLTKHAQADYRTGTGHGAIDAGVILYARGFYEKCGYDVLSKAKGLGRQRLLCHAQRICLTQARRRC